MKDIQQLIKKSNEVGRYDNVFPKTFIDAIKDRETGISLREILSSFNMFFLPYVGSKTATRLLLPKSFRRQGVWLTYVTWNKTVVIEWYDNDAIDDTSFGDDVNWRQGSNMLVGDITINAEGNWVINGEDTGIPARGEQGITPILRVSEDNRLEVSYNEGNTWNSFRDIPVFVRYRVHNNKLQESVNFEKTWEDVSDYIGAWFRWNKTSEIEGTLQISRDEKKTWEDISPVIATDIITNSEDIVKNNSKELEFANKEYNPEQFSGLGRVYLRNNIVDGKNILTQEMINKPNTTYIIQYDYDLTQSKINLPKNSMLSFQGGKISNGTIIGNNSTLNSDLVQIFNNIILEGEWNINQSYPEWFGDTIEDSSDAIQKALDFSKISSGITYLTAKTYKISKTLEMSGYLLGSNQMKTILTSDVDDLTYLKMTPFSDVKYIRFKMNKHSKQIGVDTVRYKSSISKCTFSGGLIGINLHGVIAKIDSCYFEYIPTAILITAQVPSDTKIPNTCFHLYNTSFFKCNICITDKNDLNLPSSQTFETVIEKCVFEQSEDKALELNRTRLLTIKSCWFESNKNSSILTYWQITLENNFYNYGEPPFIQTNHKGDFEYGYGNLTEIQPGSVKSKYFKFASFWNDRVEEDGTLHLYEGILNGGDRTVRIANINDKIGQSIPRINENKNNNKTTPLLQSFLSINKEAEIEESSFNLEDVAATKISTGIYEITFPKISNYNIIITPVGTSRVSLSYDTYNSTAYDDGILHNVCDRISIKLIDEDGNPIDKKINILFFHTYFKQIEL